ncbi:GPKOW protein, partial [Pomatostomus ruficeps]|nr:GPKOW protein [Pomatostomus ruficeps]
CLWDSAGSDTETDTNFLTAVEDQELLSTQLAPSPLKELVILLIPPHRLRNLECPCTDTHPAPATDDTPSTDPTPTRASPHPSLVEAQVVQELLQEVRQSQEQPQEGSEPPLSISLQLPDKNIATGPLPTTQDYEGMPMGQFRLAMLPGMGWSQGQGIGRTFPRVVHPLEHWPHLRGLVLGEGNPL